MSISEKVRHIKSRLTIIKIRQNYTLRGTDKINFHKLLYPIIFDIDIFISRLNVLLLPQYLCTTTSSKSSSSPYRPYLPGTRVSGFHSPSFLTWSSVPLPFIEFHVKIYKNLCSLCTKITEWFRSISDSYQSSTKRETVTLQQSPKYSF